MIKKKIKDMRIGSCFSKDGIVIKLTNHFYESDNEPEEYYGTVIQSTPMWKNSYPVGSVWWFGPEEEYEVVDWSINVKRQENVED